MATKLELAESLTVPQLRELAAEQGVDLAGLSSKDEIADAVAAGVSKADLEAATGEGGDAPDAPAPPSTGTATRGQGSGGGGRMSMEESEITPRGPQPQEIERQEPEAQDQVSPVDLEAQAEAGQSAADAELRLPQRAAGEEIIVKANPETPSKDQILSADQAVAGPPNVSVTVQDSEGNDVEQQVDAGDAALIQQRTAASNPQHPAFAAKGHYASPNQRLLSPEEKQEDRDKYDSRVGG